MDFTFAVACMYCCDDVMIHRVFNATDLVMLGVGCTVGAGIMVLTGVAARETAGCERSGSCVRVCVCACVRMKFKQSCGV
jgi:hypothetical protein